MQILIQSKKEDLSKHISSIKNSTQKESKSIKEISDSYIEFLNNLNINKKSSTKNYYIVIKKEKKIIENNNEQNINNMENIIFDELNDDYLKIKETLSRCGNIAIDINQKEICKNILFSFFYPAKVLNFGGDY